MIIMSIHEYVWVGISVEWVGMMYEQVCVNGCEYTSGCESVNRS